MSSNIEQVFIRRLSWTRLSIVKLGKFIRRGAMTNPDYPITPGEILLEEYLKPMGISQNAMARAIGVSPRAINEIVRGRRSITPAMSIRFGAFFGQSDQFWHGIQVECDFRRIADDRDRLTNDIQPASSLIRAP